MGRQDYLQHILANHFPAMNIQTKIKDPQISLECKCNAIYCLDNTWDTQETEARVWAAYYSRCQQYHMCLTYIKHLLWHLKRHAEEPGNLQAKRNLTLIMASLNSLNVLEWLLGSGHPMHYQGSTLHCTHTLKISAGFFVPVRIFITRKQMTEWWQ